ncbi:MAG: adenylate/guanylate cyclase domain-containing protein [Anaerolineales bacterium]|nr:adenylate/guanylate cyclase domain-containing protein [Anaerolineales bacterium]
MRNPLERQTSSSINRRQIVIIVVLMLLLIGIEITGLLPGVSTPLERLELSARDTAMRLRGERDPAPEIVVVAIDDDSLNWLGERWPWSRERVAEIVSWLAEAGARVVALDFTLFDPAVDPAEDEALLAALDKTNTAVTVSQVISTDFSVSVLRPIAMYEDVLDGYGITEVERDDDSIVRGIVAYKSTSQGVYYNWAFEIARLYLGAEPPSDPRSNAITFNGTKVPLVQGNVLLIDYAGPAFTYNNPTSYNQRPYSAAFLPLDDYPAEAFRDKIVIIGATSETLQDLYPTPFSATTLTPGVEVIANAVAMLIEDDYLRLAPPWLTLLLVVAAAIVAWFLVKIPRPSLSIAGVVVIMLGYFLIRYLIFVLTGWQFAIMTPLTMLFLGVIVPNLEQAVTQEIEKRRVRSLFSRFISPEMVSQMLDTQDIDSLNKRTELTILFSDIRGFTSLSEKLRPEQVVALLNPYLEAMTEIIHKYGGTVDKYEGDAIVAFFGEPIPYPDHAMRAAHASLAMRQELTRLTERWQREGHFTDTFEMGIGLNTGEVFVGLVGSEQRVNYTIIGDDANLAARIQDLTKEYGWPILVSHSTYQQIKDHYLVEFVDTRRVKGKVEPVTIYKLLGLKRG